MHYPGFWDFAGMCVMGIFASLYYLQAKSDHKASWPLPVASFALWAFIYFLLGWGFFWQVLGQLGLCAAVIAYNIKHKREINIVR